MSFDYTSLLNVASSLIDNFGQSWTILKVNKQIYDPATNMRNEVGTSSYSVKAIRLGSKKKHRKDDTLESSGILLLVDAKDLTITPSVTDKISDGTNTWAINSVNELKPGSTVLYYEMEISK